MYRSNRLAAFLLGGLVLFASACGGGDSKGGPTDPTEPPPPPPPVIGAPASLVVEGDGKSWPTQTVLSSAGRVLVKDEDGAGVPNVTVRFTVASGGGSLAASTATTDANGRANVPAWTLGAAMGTQQLQARVDGVATPVVIGAEGRLPRWTVMVYLAADNTLAIPGVFDLDEMEAAGSHPDVRVAVQAEFSPTQLAQVGCGSQCFNRPNFNTFRYVVPQTPGAGVRGPNGPVIDIGNRNMVDPAELSQFIAWAKATQPAERYALVLWNHGGGYTGLIEDVTSGGTRLMSLAELRSALGGEPAFDLIDFDMCLMAGFETLLTLKDRASHVVFSEEVVPGEGNQYTRLLKAMQNNPERTPAQMASVFVDEFHASYAGSRSSTTMSAYAMSGLPAAEQALGALATTLRANLSTLGSSIQASAGVAQKFEYPQLTDLGNVLDSLAVRVPDAAVQAQIASLRSALMAPTFRLASKARKGTDGRAADVRRATGLHILLPSGQQRDALPGTGPGSFAAYQALYPNSPWTAFLADYLAVNGSKSYVDQGEANRFEAYALWDESMVSKGVDIDMWLLEPDGNLYSPAFGSISPNGRFTADSYDSEQWYEGWLTNRHIQTGRYKFYAFLFADPQGQKPLVDLRYRMRGTDAFSSVFSPDYPQLSKANSILNDATPTFDEIESGAYGDVRYLAYLDIPPAGEAGRQAPLTASLQSAAAPAVSALRATGTEVRPTAAQLRRAQELVRGRQSKTKGPWSAARTPRGLRALGASR